jgi:hypothetical protein
MRIKRKLNLNLRFSTNQTTSDKNGTIKKSLKQTEMCYAPSPLVHVHRPKQPYPLFPFNATCLHRRHINFNFLDRWILTFRWPLLVCKMDLLYRSLLEAAIATPLLWQNQPELYRLKYVSPFLRAPTCFKRYNPLACRVTSR